MWEGCLACQVSFFVNNYTLRLNIQMSSFYVTSLLLTARVYSHDTLLTLAKDGEVPIVSGLCDKYHPLQILADFVTLQVIFSLF